MSDAVVIALIGSTATTIGVVITAVLTYFGNRRHSAENKDIVNKVKDYHKEVNGKMAQLLDTTEALGIAKGKAEEKDRKIDEGEQREANGDDKLK